MDKFLLVSNGCLKLSVQNLIHTHPLAKETYRLRNRHIGTLWSRPTFHVYVRQSRYTKAQLDKPQEFTVSVPLKGISRDAFRICGTKSGRDIDKADFFTLEDPRTNHTPGVREYPLTIECRVLFSQELPLEKIPEDIRKDLYPQDVDGTFCMANRDAHTMYVGEIVDAYIIRD